MSEFKYSGGELERFALARNWKSYWSEVIRPFIIGDVLEVGAGIGSNTPFMSEGKSGRWVCLEPDLQQVASLQESVKGINGGQCEVICGTLLSLDASYAFDTIIYIDVLEHIEDDRAELRRALSHLRPEGKIIVLAPAHEWLSSSFDRAVGHRRRYNRKTLGAIAPVPLRRVRLCYLDSFGVAAAMARRLLLRSNIPSQAQVQLWDKYLVPISKMADGLVAKSLGKSIIGIWQLRTDCEH